MSYEVSGKLRRRVPELDRDAQWLKEFVKYPLGIVDRYLRVGAGLSDLLLHTVISEFN